jgi:hypothetical protein
MSLLLLDRGQRQREGAVLGTRCEAGGRGSCPAGWERGSAGASPSRTEATPAPRPLLWRRLAVLLLGGLLLFAHIGCHGDEDNELFARVARAVQ